MPVYYKFTPVLSTTPRTVSYTLTLTQTQPHGHPTPRFVDQLAHRHRPLSTRTRFPGPGDSHLPQGAAPATYLGGRFHYPCPLPLAPWGSVQCSRLPAHRWAAAMAASVAARVRITSLAGCACVHVYVCVHVRARASGLEWFGGLEWASSSILWLLPLPTLLPRVPHTTHHGEHVLRRSHPTTECIGGAWRAAGGAWRVVRERVKRGARHTGWRSVA